jgi:hypothetical protein
LTVIEEEVTLENTCLRLVPPLLLGIQGIWCEIRDDHRWRFWRDLEATTWEDFLLMHVTHRLAFSHDALLSYSSGLGVRLIDSTPDAFLTFDHYVDHVLRNEEGLVRDIKRNWMYGCT